ncbi:MAG: CBS domain-containing protein [Rhodospirillales bacterium]
MIGITIVPDVIEGTGAASIAATATVGEAASGLAAGGAGALAVIGEGGRVSGLIDATGIVRAVAEGGAAALDRPVAAIAVPVGDTLAPGDTALDALDLLRLRDVEHLPVINSAGRLLGIVSRRRLGDILHRCLEAEFERRAAAVFGGPPAQSGDLP